MCTHFIEKRVLENNKRREPFLFGHFLSQFLQHREQLRVHCSPALLGWLVSAIFACGFHRLVEDKLQAIRVVYIPLSGVGEQEQPIVVYVFRQEIIRSEEHTSELQSLMRISYAVFCLKKKKLNK